MRDIFNETDMDERLAALLAEGSAALAAADLARQRDVLNELADVCRNIGPAAAAAVPLLMGWPITANREAEESVCYALSYCAPASIVPLLEQLDDLSETARQRACRTLSLIGPDFGDHLISVSDGLLRRLRDPSVLVRKAAAFALGFTGDARPQVIERLKEIGHAGSTAERAAALHALGNIGGAALKDRVGLEWSPTASCADLVLSALDDADEDVRRSACHGAMRESW